MLRISRNGRKALNVLVAAAVAASHGAGVALAAEATGNPTGETAVTVPVDDMPGAVGGAGPDRHDPSR